MIVLHIKCKYYLYIFERLALLFNLFSLHMESHNIFARNFCFLMWVLVSPYVALWGLSLTCALVTREFGRMMRPFSGYIAITLHYLGKFCNLITIILFLRFQIKLREDVKLWLKDDEAILGIYCHNFVYRNKSNYLWAASKTKNGIFWEFFPLGGPPPPPPPLLGTCVFKNKSLVCLAF